jgi:release factor glutamine methyltransferase
LSSVKELLTSTPLQSIDAKVLLSFLCHQFLGWSKSQLISRDHEALPEVLLLEWKRFEQQRLEGLPVAYLIGTKAFYNIELQVNNSVLIPRPDTELLVDFAIQEIKKRLSADSELIHCLDLGTGSGAIALAIAFHFKDHPKAIERLKILATDTSTEALVTAETNSAHLGLGHFVSFKQSDWFSDLGVQTFDLIISNPPYISKDDPHLKLGDLRFEPISALTDFSNGLANYVELIYSAKSFLLSGGCIAFEHGYNQSKEISDLLLFEGFSSPQTLQDLAGLDRITFSYLN